MLDVGGGVFLQLGFLRQGCRRSEGYCDCVVGRILDGGEYSPAAGRFCSGICSSARNFGGAPGVVAEIGGIPVRGASLGVGDIRIAGAKPVNWRSCKELADMFALSLGMFCGVNEGEDISGRLIASMLGALETLLAAEHGFQFFRRLRCLLGFCSVSSRIFGGADLVYWADTSSRCSGGRALAFEVVRILATRRRSGDAGGLRMRADELGLGAEIYWRGGKTEKFRRTSILDRWVDENFSGGMGDDDAGASIGVAQSQLSTQESQKHRGHRERQMENGYVKGKIR